MRESSCCYDTCTPPEKTPLLVLDTTAACSLVPLEVHLVLGRPDKCVAGAGPMAEGQFTIHAMAMHEPCLPFSTCRHNTTHSTDKKGFAYSPDGVSEICGERIRLSTQWGSSGDK